MSRPPRVLLIEDDPAIAESLRPVLEDDGCALVCECRGDEGLRRAMLGSFDVVLTDLRLPGLGGLDLVRQLHTSHPRIPIILMTAHGTTDTAIEAIKFGAYDYLLKPFRMEELLDMVRRAVASSFMMTVPVELNQPVPARDAILGNSRAMQSIYKEIGRVAATSLSVLIRGETGTGKELIARAIYQHSLRAAAPFIAVNTAALPETLLESELFGHEKGAFTGADVRRIGRFEQANGGTLFLDEVGEMSVTSQAKLLRVIQEKSIQRLGGRDTIPVDVRLLAATHRDLEAAVAEKTFREDLYYRLSVVTLTLPPLRDRREDIPVLAQYFRQRYSAELGTRETALPPEAVALLQAHGWPGNVRELENVVRKIVLAARGFPITVEIARDALRNAAPFASSGPDESLAGLIARLLTDAQSGDHGEAYAHAIAATERELFRQAIEVAGGNQAKAARWLGISRLMLREKLTQFGLHPRQNPAEP